MRGDVTDIAGRLRTLLPPRWFSDQSPNLDALLTCLATPWAWLYQVIQYVIQQARLATASATWLDLIAGDFLGTTLLRNTGEADSAYRARIAWALVEESGTRVAVNANLTNLIGFAPRIFEPANCADTGAYGYGGTAALSASTYIGMAYGETGGWGSLILPLQFFLETRRPVISGVSKLAGYGTGGGGYGVGLIGYVDLALLSGNVTESDIQTCLSRSLPVNTVAWLRIT